MQCRESKVAESLMNTTIIRHIALKIREIYETGHIWHLCGENRITNLIYELTYLLILLVNEGKEYRENPVFGFHRATEHQ